MDQQQQRRVSGVESSQRRRQTTPGLGQTVPGQPDHVVSQNHEAAATTASVPSFSDLMRSEPIVVCRSSTSRLNTSVPHAIMARELGMRSPQSSSARSLLMLAVRADQGEVVSDMVRRGSVPGFGGPLRAEDFTDALTLATENMNNWIIDCITLSAPDHLDIDVRPAMRVAIGKIADPDYENKFARLEICKVISTRFMGRVNAVGRPVELNDVFQAAIATDDFSCVSAFMNKDERRNTVPLGIDYGQALSAASRHNSHGLNRHGLNALEALLVYAPRESISTQMLDRAMREAQGLGLSASESRLRTEIQDRMETMLEGRPSFSGA